METHERHIVCAKDECGRWIKDNGWAKTQAHFEGWFFERTGNVWCPDHNPEWVEEWRKGIRERASQKRPDPKAYEVVWRTTVQAESEDQALAEVMDTLAYGGGAGTGDGELQVSLKED